jgi:hypothetical protein
MKLSEALNMLAVGMVREIKLNNESVAYRYEEGQVVQTTDGRIRGDMKEMWEQWKWMEEDSRMIWNASRDFGFGKRRREPTWGSNIVEDYGYVLPTPVPARRVRIQDYVNPYAGLAWGGVVDDGIGHPGWVQQYEAAFPNRVGA